MRYRSTYFYFVPFLLLILVLTGCKTQRQNTNKLVDWIPQNTTAVLQVNDYNALKNALTNNGFLKEIPSQLPELSEKIKSISTTEITPQLISLSNYGKEEKAVSVVYKAALDSSYLAHQKVEYSGENIYVQKKSNGQIYTAFIDGFTLHTDTKIVLENCIRNYQQNAKGLNNSAFYNITKTADKQAPLNLHIIGDKEKSISDAIGDLPLFPNIGQRWSSYDLYPVENTIEMDGLLEIVDSLGDPVGILHSSNPQKSQITQAIPKSMTAFFAVTLDNVQTLESKFKKWVLFHNHPLPSTELNALKSIDEFALVQLNKENALVFHLRNEETAAAIFIPESDPKTYRNQAYYKTSLARPIVSLISSLGENITVKWIAKIDDFLFFSETESSLKTLIAAYKDEKTLMKDPTFQQFYEDILSEQFSLFWVTQTDKIYSQYPDINLWKNMDRDKYPYLGLQGLVEDNFLHLHFRFHQNKVERQEQTATNIALLSLDHPLAGPPQWIKNHRTKEKDIVVQDQQNYLYLFSNTGKLFWKKKVSGKIRGKIQQVDLYRNGRLQMAFRTEKRFMILDRNGKIVAPFNKVIKASEPIQPLAVFDYDQRRDYRFLLAQGRNVLMLDGKGRNVKGFTFKRATSNVVLPPKHIRIDNKDFIVIKEENGTLNLLNRTGKQRVKVKSNNTYSDQAIYSYLKTFTTSDNDGNLVQIDTKGNVVKSPLGLEQGHQITSTTKSLVTLSGNLLTIKGLPINLPYGNYSAPKIFYLNNIIYITVTDLEAQKVYLYYSNGTLVSGFPVYGTSAIDLANADKDNAVELIVQSETSDILIYEIK